MTRGNQLEVIQRELVHVTINPIVVKMAVIHQEAAQPTLNHRDAGVSDAECGTEGAAFGRAFASSI